MTEIIRPASPADMVCDFCSSKDVRWTYLAHDFAVEDLSWGSHEGWAACDPCHDLIERGEWDTLIDRNIARFPVWMLDQAQRTVLRRQLRDLYGRFRQSTFGPARPFHKG